MAIQVEVITESHNLIKVNGKEVQEDMSGNWIAKEELSPMEYKFFREFLGSRSRISAPILKATYKL